MKVELGISMASNVVSMSGCSQAFEGNCGIMYRAGLA